jgi:hypothetical protein
MKEKGKTLKILIGNPQWKSSLQRLGVNGR